MPVIKIKIEKSIILKFIRHLTLPEKKSSKIKSITKDNSLKILQFWELLL